MDDLNVSDQLVALTCMVQSLTDQFKASQRHTAVAPARPPESSRIDDAAHAMNIEATTLVLRLQRDLDTLRAEMSAEIRTQSVIVDDGKREVVITPGDITVERHATEDDERSGTSVHIQSLPRSAEVSVGAATVGQDSVVVATVNANWEGPHPVALLSAQGTSGGDDQQQEIRVETAPYPPEETLRK